MNQLILTSTDRAIRSFHRSDPSMGPLNLPRIDIEFVVDSALGKELEHHARNALGAASSPRARDYKFELLISHSRGTDLYEGCFVCSYTPPRMLGRRTIGVCQLSYDKFVEAVQELPDSMKKRK